MLTCSSHSPDVVLPRHRLRDLLDQADEGHAAKEEAAGSLELSNL